MSVAQASQGSIKRKSSFWSQLFTSFWVVVISSVLLFGWINRGEGYIHAESGLGYWLGIIGGSLMLLLLTYSMRKRWRILRRFLTVKFWFRLHMTFGLVGPVAILYHGNFSISSLNSTVALVCMLLVAGSGIIGRFIYTRIHFGLYGEKVKLQQVLKDFHALQNIIVPMAVEDQQRKAASRIFTMIKELIDEQTKHLGFFASYKSRRKARKVTRQMTKLVSHLLKYHRKHSVPTAELEATHRQLRKNTAVLSTALKKLPGLQFWEGVFSYWHVIHIPIFILMIITALVHVVVVHMY